MKLEDMIEKYPRMKMDEKECVKTVELETNIPIIEKELSEQSLHRLYVGACIAVNIRHNDAAVFSTAFPDFVFSNPHTSRGDDRTRVVDVVLTDPSRSKLVEVGAISIEEKALWDEELSERLKRIAFEKGECEKRKIKWEEEMKADLKRRSKPFYKRWLGG